MSKVREVQTFNRGLFSTMSSFELRKRDNGKTTLGTGSFGAVHLACHTQSDTLYAIKIIQGSNITTPYEQEGIEREIKVHLRANNPNIVKLYDSFQENEAVYMVMEYVPNGNLYNYVQKKKRLEEKEACKYFVQTCQALHYLHEHNVFHRDIKPENLLLDGNNNIKLCDFGWCAENINLKRKTFCGTYEYMAPEIVSDIAYDFTIDIWSVGVLLYELLHGYAPFKGKEYKEIAANIKLCQIKFSSSVAQDAQDLITQILQKEPSHRPSFNDIYKSAFVNRLLSANQGLVKQSIKVDTYSSPRLSQDESVIKYQSPLQNHQPKGRLNLATTNDKQQILKSTNQSLLNNSKTKVQQPTYEIKKKNSINTIDPKPVTEPKGKSLITVMRSLDDIKKRINFEQITPLKDNTVQFQNQQTASIGICQSVKAEEPIIRRKSPSTTSFFCNSTQSSSQKGIFTQEKKVQAPKTAIMNQQPALFRSFKAQEKGASDKKPSLITQYKQSPLQKLNSKSKSGFAFIQDENIYKDYSKKMASTKTTARKEKTTYLEQYKSLPSEITYDKQKPEDVSSTLDPSSRQNLLTERPAGKLGNGLQFQSKNDFDRILKMYMSLCTES